VGCPDSIISFLGISFSFLGVWCKSKMVLLIVELKK